MSAQLPLLASITVVFMILAGYLVVRARDLVYSSASLAILGLLNAALLAIMGYTIIAAFLVIVYVGAAVMFIIIVVSMLGGGGGEARDEEKGLFAATALATVAILIATTGRIYGSFTRPEGVSMASVSELLLSDYGVVLSIIFVALAATLVEAISIARRG